MSFVKRLEFGNYTLKFGSEKVLLDMFDEIVMPSFHEMKYIRKVRGGSEFFFLDTELIVLDDNAEHPVLGLTGRIVKLTKLKRDQIFRDGSLLDDKDEMESAPSSTFLLILNSHRLILTKEVPGAPTIQNFQHTSQYCLSKAYEVYISRQREMADEAREQNAKLERVTKKKLMEDTPPPYLRITPLADKESLDNFIGRFKTIKKLSIKLLPTNHEIDNDDFWAPIEQSRVSMGGDSAIKLDFTSNSTGLDNNQVLGKTVTATALGNSAVDIRGIDEHGDALQGNQESFSLSIDVEELPREVNKSAVIQYEKFNELIHAGAITMPKIAGKTIDSIKKLFGRL